MLPVYKYSVLFLVLFAVVGCNNNDKSVAENIEGEKQLNADSSVQLPDGHNAQNSLDVAGTYKGILPCADCEGMETTITINEDQTYLYRVKYLGKGDGKPVEEKGPWSWISAQYIELETLSDRPTWYAVEENRIVQLSRDGKRIRGNLEDRYILKKTN